MIFCFILRQVLKVPSLLQVNIWERMTLTLTFLTSTSQVLRLQPVLPLPVWGCAGDWTCITRQALNQHSWLGTCCLESSSLPASSQLCWLALSTWNVRAWEKGASTEKMPPSDWKSVGYLLITQDVRGPRQCQIWAGDPGWYKKTNRMIYGKLASSTPWSLLQLLPSGSWLPVMMDRDLWNQLSFFLCCFWSWYLSQ